MHHSSQSEGGPCQPVSPENFPWKAPRCWKGDLPRKFLRLLTWPPPSCSCPSGDLENVGKKPWMVHGWYMDGWVCSKFWRTNRDLDGSAWCHKNRQAKSGDFRQKTHVAHFGWGSPWRVNHLRARFRATSFGVEQSFETWGSIYIFFTKKGGTFINPKLTLTGIKPVESQKVATKRTINHHISR